jgi:hypothetical protein
VPTDFFEGDPPAPTPPSLASSHYRRFDLVQIQNASRLPCGGISQMSVNAVLAFIEGGRAEERGRGGTSHTDGLHAHSHHGGNEQGPEAPMAVTGTLPGWRRRQANFSGHMPSRSKHCAGYVPAAQTIRIEKIEIRDGAQSVIGTVGPSNPKASEVISG